MELDGRGSRGAPLLSRSVLAELHVVSQPVFSVVRREARFDVGVSVRRFRAQCLKHGAQVGRSVSWDAGQRCHQGAHAMGAMPRQLSEEREGRPGLMDCLARFQVSKPWSEDTETEPVLSSGGWQFSRAFPAPTPDWQSLWLREQRSRWGLRIPAAEGLAAAVYTGDFPDSDALRTGIGMLLIQHCVLKNHSEDKWPLGWAMGRGPGPLCRLVGPPRMPPLADCGQTLWVESLLSRQHWVTTPGRRHPEHWLKGARLNKTRLPSSILGCPSGTAR